MDLSRNRALPRDGAGIAAADRAGSGRRDPRAPPRSLRVLRRGARGSRRAQAPALVYGGASGRRRAARRGERRGIGRGTATGGRAFLRPACWRMRAIAVRGRRPSRSRLCSGAPGCIAGMDGGGTRGVKKNVRLNGSNEIGRSVERSLDEYFRRLDGEPPHGIYDMVIAHVERAMLASMLERSNGNQTQAAEMLGLNRNTLRAKLAKYKLI